MKLELYDYEFVCVKEIEMFLMGSEVISCNLLEFWTKF